MRRASATAQEPRLVAGPAAAQAAGSYAPAPTRPAFAGAREAAERGPEEAFAIGTAGGLAGSLLDLGVVVLR